MRSMLIACAVALAVALAAPAAAGQEPADGGEAVLGGSEAEHGGDAVLGGGALPVSLARIRQRLASLPADERRLLLRLSTRVNVYARAQAGEVLQGFNVESWNSPLGGRTGGGIAYGSPTHNEMVNAMTPAFWRERSSSLAGITVGW